jgi:hypothetical protein
MTWLEITLWSIPASLPAWLLWRWRVRRAHARMIAETMEYRRQKFGGVIREPGKRGVTRIER